MTRQTVFKLSQNRRDTVVVQSVHGKRLRWYEDDGTLVIVSWKLELLKEITF